MPDDSEFGLDYGPAPLDFEAAMKNSEKQVEAHKRDKPFTMDYLRKVAGTPEGDAEAFGAAQAQELPERTDPVDLSMTTGGAVQSANFGPDPKLPMIESPSKFGDTPSGVMKELVVNRGMKFGEAMTTIKDLYDKGSPYIRSLPDIDRFIEQMPSTGKLAVNKLLMKAGEPVARVVELFGGKNPDLMDVDTTIKMNEELMPPSRIADLAGSVPEIAMWTALQMGAAPIAARTLLGISELSPAARGAVAAIKAGGPVLKESIKEIGSRGQYWTAQALSAYAATTTNNLLYGREEPFLPSKWDIGVGIGGYALGSLFRRGSVNAALHFVEQATGTKGLADRIDTLDKMLVALKTANASDLMIAKVIQEGAETYGEDFGRYVGRWAARSDLGEKGLESIISGVKHEGFGKAAKQGFDDAIKGIERVLGDRTSQNQIARYMRSLGATDEDLAAITTSPQAFKSGAAKWMGRWVASTGQDVEMLDDMTRALPAKYYKQAIDEYNETFRQLHYGSSPLERAEAKMAIRGEKTAHSYQNYMVVDPPSEVGGAQKYFAPYSVDHLNNLKSWTLEKEIPNITYRAFKNPIEVPLDPNQIPGYALIERLKGNPKLAAAAKMVLDNTFSKANALPQSQVNDMIEAVGNQLAKRFGYDSIIYKGATAERNMYVDLRNVVPLEPSAQKIVDRMEKSMQAAGRRAVGKNFLSIAVPLTGLAAWDLMRPKRSEAMPDMRVLGKGSLSEFITFISKTGQQLFGHEIGVNTHFDLIKHLDEFIGIPEYSPGWGKRLRESIEQGGLRAGRNEVGPFTEFYWNHEPARNLAYDFIKKYTYPGDVAALEMHFNQKSSINMYGNMEDILHTIKHGEPPIRASRMRDFLGIALPVGTGLGLMLPPDQADAIDFEPLMKVASKFKSVSEFAEQLPKQTASVIKQAAMLTEEGNPKKLVKVLAGIQDDLYNARPNIRLDYTHTGPDFLGVNVHHDDLGPFPLANIFGVVDPHNGTWYPQVSATPLGFNKEALQSVGEKVKTEHSWIKRIANPKSLAGIVAATYMLKDFVWPDNRAEAIEIPEPLLKAFGQGIKGADGSLIDAAKSKTMEEMLGATFERIKGIQKKVAGRNLREESAAGDAWLRFDTDGGLTEESQQFLGSLNSGEGFNSAYRWRPPWSMSENPLWQMFLGKFISLKDALLTGEGSTNALTKARAAAILREGGIVEADNQELYRAVHGMRTTSKGGVLQTAPNISPRINTVAEQLHREIIDPLWVMNTGIDPRAYAILDELGLDHSEGTLRDIKAIQNKPMGAPSPRGATAAHDAASIRMANMLNWKPWNTIRVPYNEGKFTIMPIRNERKALLSLLEDRRAMYGQPIMPDQQSSLDVLEKRLEDLNRGEIEFRNMQRPKMDVLGMKHLPTGSMFRRNKPQVPIEMQYVDFVGAKPGKGLLDFHIDNSLSKAFFDETLTYAKYVRDEFGRDPLGGGRPLADYVVEFMNTLRGLKSVREDLGFAHMANSLAAIIGSDAKFHIGDIRNYANKVMEATWLTKLGVGLRFPLVNITQPMLTVAPVTGIKSLLRAYARVMNDPAIWEEARAANLLKLESGMRSEVEPSKFIKALDYIPSKSENLNRTVAYAAAKDQALEEIARTGSLKVPHFVRTFNKEVLGSGDAEKIAREYGAAVTRTTQFLYGPEGRPLAFSGGALRRVTTQFKTFAAAYADFIVGTARHGKLTGDWKPLGRAATALMLLGGPGTILPYETIRRQLLKRGVELPSDQSGFGYLLSTATSTFAQPDTAEQINRAINLLQISGSFNPAPISLGGDPNASVMQGILGPTLGAAWGTGVTGYKALTGMEEKGRKVGAMDVGVSFLRSVSPLLASGMEASQEGGWLSDWYSRIGYRGGIYSPAGHLQYAPPRGLLGDAEIAMRAVNLRSSPRNERYEYVQDIKAAQEGGQYALAGRLKQQAENKGYKFGPSDFGGKVGQAPKKPKKPVVNEPLRRK